MGMKFSFCPAEAAAVEKLMCPLSGDWCAAAQPLLVQGRGGAQGGGHSPPHVRQAQQLTTLSKFALIF